MKKYYLHRQICFLLLLQFFITSSNGQITPAELQASVDAGIDPYFIETTDTVSTHGPNHITRDLLQDKNGNFWFATWEGIIGYDGKVFTNYTLKEGLIHFHVFSLFEDKKGNLWFGTVRGGVYRYDPSASLRAGSKLFTLFTTKDGLGDNTAECMMEDKDGNIWFATSGGASRYDGKTFTNFTTKDGLCDNDINSIIQDKTGKLWFGTGEGISCYNGKTFTDFKNKEGLPFEKVIALFEDKTGKIWIGRFDGLTVYDPSASLSTGSKSVPDGKAGFTDLLTNFLTYYIIEDQAGNIWLTHSEPNTHNANLPDQVLYRYDASTSLSTVSKTFTKIIEKYEPNDFQIFGKIEDTAGNIWFGTMHGPCRYDGKTFTYFTE